MTLLKLYLQNQESRAKKAYGLFQETPFLICNEVGNHIDPSNYRNLSALGPIQKLMDESRKLNIAVVGATQPYRIRGNDVCDVMRNATTKVFVKPTDDSIDDVAKTLHYGKKKAEYFDQMNVNDVIINSPLYDKDLKRNVMTTLRGEIAKYRKEKKEEE